MWGWLFYVAAAAVLSGASGAGAGAARLVCYVESAAATAGFSECTHLVYAGDARGDKLDGILKEYRKNNPRLKIVLRVADTDKDLRTLLKSKHIHGLEIHNAHKTLNKTKVSETVEAAHSAIKSSGGPLLLALPAHPELLAKYYDLRELVKKADLMMVQTHALGMVKKMTYHPSRLSGVWDMMNTDSVVDLVVGLGVPAHKIVVSLPATARQFTLQNETLSTPGSPTQEEEPKEIDQAELCRQLRRGKWTLERDQDLSAPYAFKNKTWISFEDSSSVDVKGKYARVRGLAGLALQRADRDADTPCGPTLKASLAKVLNQQSRAPRAAVLRSLEHEILSAPGHARALDALQVSPYRITQVVDSDGVIHSIREDTRTEFACSRQGYFVHPRSCARFYRCVKFDQLSPEYTVFEFDCPAGLAFDSRYEVCVWPGSLPHTQACPGSSEIAPVPKTRFICPEHEGYYADPENCRWFFACLDHGKAPLTAYEFRCPFGLGFDAEKLKCDWPWLVPACGNIARYEAEAYGFSAATLTGAAGYQGQTADAINVAAHQSLVSGAALDNLVGIQGGFLSASDALDSNYIASQELANGGLGAGHAYEVGHGSGADQAFGIAQDVGQFAVVHNGAGIAQTGNGVAYQGAGVGLVQPTNYNGGAKKYTSGSIILDDYRLPTKDEINRHAAQQGDAVRASISGAYTKGTILNGGVSSSYSTGSSGQGQRTVQYQSANYGDDNSGAYVHDPSGDHAEPYTHQDSPVEPYLHDGSPYKHTGDYYDTGKYTGSSDSGQYSGSYDAGKYTGSSDAGKYTGSSDAGKYTGSSDAGKYTGSSDAGTYIGSYQSGNDGKYRGSTQSGYEGNYAGSYQIDAEGKYVDDNSGQYVHDNSGAYVETTSGGSGYKGQYSGSGYKGGYSGSNGYGIDNSGSNGYTLQYSGNAGYNGAYSGSGYKADYSGAYNDNSGAYKQDDSGKYTAGVYRPDGHIGEGKATSAVNIQQYHGYSEANAENYVNDANAYTGGSHTLTAGAINVGLVGKTTLVDADYDNQYNYDGSSGQSFSQSSQTLHPGHVSYVSQPAVSISHIGTDGNNLDGYSYVTTPTSSGIPTTATPFAVTTAIPTVTYRTTYVPKAPSTSIKQVFGVSHPAVTYVQPTVVAVKQVSPKVQITDHNQFGLKTGYSTGTTKTESGYDYSKPSVNFEDGVSYTTAAPALAVTTYKPQGFGHSQQTLHKVDSVGFQYSNPIPVSEEPFKRIVAYTTGSPVTYSQPTAASYTPQSYSHQTIHKIESSNVYTPSVETASADTGYEYTNTGVAYEEPKIVQYTTAQPALAVQPVVSTYQPQVVSHQTLHKVDASRVNTYSDDSSGYKYEQPAVDYEEVKTVYSTPAPIVTSTYKPQAYSHQTLHKVETQKYVPVSSTPKVEYTYQSTPTTVYENPILKYTQKVTPVTYVEPTYKSQAFSHQTIHKVENTQAYSPVDTDYQYTKSVAYEQPQTIQYTTVQPAVVSTYQPQVFSQQTLHNVDASQVNTYSQDTDGYEYSQPAVKFAETAKTAFEYSTAVPVVTSTYKPQSYSHQTIHKVETQKYVPVSTTAAPAVDLSYQKSVTTYENPILKYTKTVTPVTYVQPTPTVYTQTYKPIVQQHEVSHVVSQPVQYEQNVQFSQEGYSYSQPEIQRNIETNSANSYSDASAVSHQVFHQSSDQTDYNSGKDVVFVSTTPATLVHESHYADYESPKVETYKAPEYVPPKNDYKSYSVSTAAPVVHQSSVVHQSHEYVAPETGYNTYTVSSTPSPLVHEAYIHQTQDDYDYKPVEYSQQFDTVQQTPQQVSFSTSHVEQPQKVESIHFSYPSSTATTHYQQAEYQSPEIQVAYKAEEYLPPVVSTATPIVSSTYRPRIYSTASSYPSSTARTIVKSTTPAYRTESTTAYQSGEYLSHAEESDSKVVSYENFGYNGADIQRVNPYQEYSVTHDTASVVAPVQRKQNIVVETAKSQLLGFGTVGPDAGLVSEVTYTTAAPVVSSTYRQRVKSTSRPSYRYQSTTEYQAPEYLPPSEDTESELNLDAYGYKNVDTVSTSGVQYNPYQEAVVVSTAAPVQRKHNIVVQTAKSQQLGFGTVGHDAGYVSPVTYSTAAPVIVSSSDSYSLSPKIVTSTYAPVEQGLFEVTPSTVPLRRTKPKVAVVTKINDFNPFLVRKLGAVCSCQSPVLILKGKKPTQAPQDLGDFNDYDDSARGDSGIHNAGVNTYTTAAPIVTSTFNPIIVPDDSYYQDYQEQSHYDVAVTPKHRGRYSESYVSSTPVPVSSTEKAARVRQRVKAVTVAPTYQTVLLNREVTPTVSIQNSGSVSASAIDFQAFDRYGPGGWRSRDETLQGSVDCQRAGLFRHPKQCNKFYACRWDCTKQRFTLHVFNCPIQLSFDPSLGACNWPSQGPACQGDTLLTNVL